MKTTKQTVYLPVEVEEHSNYHIFDLHECEGSYLKTVAEGYGHFFTPEQLNEYTQAVIKQALETAAEKALTKDDPYSYTGNIGSEYPADIIVDKESIANTAEETFKKFEV